MQPIKKVTFFNNMGPYQTIYPNESFGDGRVPTSIYGEILASGVLHLAIVFEGSAEGSAVQGRSEAPPPSSPIKPPSVPRPDRPTTKPADPLKPPDNTIPEGAVEFDVSASYMVEWNPLVIEEV
jgi:hypothetical protein